MQSDHDQWICPSFNSYSGNNNLAEIASKVTSEGDGDVQFGHDSLLPGIAENYYQNVDDDEEDDFEFSLVLNDEFEVSEEEMIFGTKFQPPIFPIFNRDLLNNIHSEDRQENVGNSHTNFNISSSSSSVHKYELLSTIKIPLSKLFIEENEDHEPPSSSSSEADEVESIPPGRYCVWKPKAAPPSPSTCNKSKSTGFGSKRWKLRDLLRRSNSEGKDSFIFLTPKRKEEKNESKKKLSNVAKGKKSTTTTTSSATRRMLYSPANRDIMRGNESPTRSPKSTKGNGEMPKRKSYLPYRQDLVGFFTTVNSIGRNFSPL
ncbi:hypothetical protein LIER_27541 [Lithospermum erythrorhizon]|uniref:Uncharacterized protein n=1 Tax=Lithospermum erythrorhizon TaxID=34254 RepID=A0AAV3RFH4_LITER